MNIEKIIRAWKDENYRESLNKEELAALPENPAGELELNDADLNAIHGAHSGGDSFVNTNALLCLQSVLIYCFTISGNCGNAS